MCQPSHAASFRHRSMKVLLMPAENQFTAVAGAEVELGFSDVGASYILADIYLLNSSMVPAVRLVPCLWKEI